MQMFWFNKTLTVEPTPTAEVYWVRSLGNTACPEQVWTPHELYCKAEQLPSGRYHVRSVYYLFRDKGLLVRPATGFNGEGDYWLWVKAVAEERCKAVTDALAELEAVFGPVEHIDAGHAIRTLTIGTRRTMFD